MTQAKSKITTLHQILPSLHVADASGAHTLHARDALREAGYASEIFVDHVDEPLASTAHPFASLDDFVEQSRTVLLYQMAVGSRLVDPIMRRPEPLLVNYHNLTPADFYWKWAPDWLNGVETGRQQLHRLARRVTHAIAVSSFNERDLCSAGYMSTSVVPPFVNVSASEPSRVPIERLEGARWLFVGKLLPHKAAHDLVKALALYRRTYDPAASLTLVGGHPIASYSDAVRHYTSSLGIGDSVDFRGAVSDLELGQAYSSSDVFVCLSDHEGFCFPLLEAMHHGLPVVAFDAGAVGDTLGPSGILIGDKAPSVVAAAVRRVMCDRSLQEDLVAAGRRRFANFEMTRVKRQFVDSVAASIDRL